MNRNWTEKKKNRAISQYLKSCAGMTLTEMLAAVLILSMTATAIGGGVSVVKTAYKKTTEKAEAQMVLATTVELITDFLSDAQKVNVGHTDGPAFYSAETGTWMRLVSEPYRGATDNNQESGGGKDDAEETQQSDAAKNPVGICKAYGVGEDGNGEGTRIPLMTEEAMDGIFYTDFFADKNGEYKYEYNNGYFTIKNINVYYKADASNPNRVPMAHLDELIVHAVNMEGQ